MKSIKSFFLTKHFTLLVTSIFLFNVISCSYLKTKNVAPGDIPNINNIGKIHKYFVVHSGQKMFTIKDIEVDETNIKGIVTYTDKHVYYFEGRPKRISTHEKDILHEVHIYLMPGVEIDTGSTEIPLTLVREVKIIERDSGAEVATFILGTIGVGLGAFVLFFIIAIMLKSSCPYVYVSDGENFIFEGETYGGAIAKNLERDDYMPLPSIGVDKNAYRIRISNELKERQFTDLAELYIVDHECDQKVLLDKKGKPFILNKIEYPEVVGSFNGEDLKQVLRENDKNVFMFNNMEHSKNGIIMKFNKPEGSQSSKFVLNAKNTLWFDYLFGEFISKFGVKYDDWMEKQNERPSEDRIQGMRNSDFPLSIYVKKDNDWQFVDFLYTIGPLASRDFVIPMDLTGIEGSEVEIKIETGFMFWEVDKVGMDFSDDIEPEITVVKPSIATGTGSMDWTKALSYSDEEYMIQDIVGEVTEVIYENVPLKKDHERSVFLHTRGYYELIREFTGLPRVSELMKFKKPGYFSDFSRMRYLMFYNREDQFTANNVEE